MEIDLHYILLILLLICFLVQLYFLVFHHFQLKKVDKNSIVSNQKLPVSVIICARNEAENLQANLPSVLTQNYADFEVIVVNDCSTDDSQDILESFKKIYGNLKIVTVTENKRFKTGKKYALTMGIKAAKNEYLLLTDADCQPSSPNWIELMQEKFSTEKEIILGYSPYRKTGGLLNTFIRFETLKTAISYLSAALNNNPYMGVGRNLSYTKSLFFRSKGFAEHMHLISGDDDLFINKNATKQNTAVQINPDARTHSDAKSTLSSYYRQKRRHMGVGKYYKRINRLKITLDALSGFFFYIFLFILLFAKFELWVVAAVYLFRLIAQCIIYPGIFKNLEVGDLIWYFPLLDLFYYIYLNVFGIVGSVTKNLRWK